VFTPEQHVHVQSRRSASIQRLVKADFTEIPDKQTVMSPGKRKYAVVYLGLET